MDFKASLTIAIQLSTRPSFPTFISHIQLALTYIPNFTSRRNPSYNGLSPVQYPALLQMTLTETF